MNIDIKEQKENVIEVYTKYLIRELFCGNIEDYILSLEEFKKLHYINNS